MLVYTRRDAPLERYEKIHFSGIVKDYKRKNGSSDYGIHPTKFFNIHWDLEELNKEVNEYLDNVSNDSKRFTTPETLYFLEYKIKQDKRDDSHVLELPSPDGEENLITSGNQMSIPESLRLLEKVKRGKKKFRDFINQKPKFLRKEVEEIIY